MNEFETLLKNTPSHGSTGRFRDAMIEVADTAYACKVWFKSYDVQATAADIVAMTDMVMRRERESRVAQHYTEQPPPEPPTDEQQAEEQVAQPKTPKPAETT